MSGEEANVNSRRVLNDSVMSTRRGSTRLCVSNGVSAGVREIIGNKEPRENGEMSASTHPTAVALPTDVRALERRRQLLMQKQTELDQIFERHDDMIRETYHMKEWKRMLEYDPVEAKADHGEGYKTYKATFDLLRIVEEQQPTAGPSTRTRRAVKVSRIVKLDIPSPPLLLPVAPSASTPTKETLNSRPVRGRKTSQAVGSNGAMVGGKGKGKEREIDLVPELEADCGDVPVHSVTTSGARTKVSKRSKSEILGEEASRSLPRSSTRRHANSPTPISVVDVQDAAHPSGPRRSSVKRPRDVPAETPTSEQTHSKKRLKGDNGKASRKDDWSNCPTPAESDEKEVENRLNSPPPTTDGQPLTRSTRRNPNGAASIVPSSTEGVSASDLQRPPSPTGPKRVTLKLPRIKPLSIPPVSKMSTKQTRTEKPKSTTTRSATYTNPHQRPFGRPAHDSSIHALISSFTPTYKPSKIEKIASIREREAQFRKAGRFIPGTDVLFGTRFDSDDGPISLYEPPQRRTTDLWDAIIDEVVEHHQVRDTEHGKEVAARVASCINGYWDAKIAKQGKLRAVEEKKLRALAKATVKAVVAEWKRAVHHIREQERLKEEEEERRKGQEHLNAIIDQSGALLSTQQSGLHRHDIESSRASSISDGLAGWGEDSDDESVAEDADDEGRSPRSGMASEIGEGLDDDKAEGEEDDEGGLGMTSSMLTDDLLAPPEASSTNEDIPESDPPLPATPPPPSHHDDAEADDNDSIAELDDLMIPDPESSPIRPQYTPMQRRPLVDYASSPEAHSPDSSGAAQDERSQPDVESVNLRKLSPVFPEPDVHAREEDAPASPGGVDIRPSESAAGLDQAAVEDHEMEEETQEEGEEEDDDDDDEEQEEERTPHIPEYLKPFAVAPVDYDAEAPINPPLLLRGTLRPYQQSGLEWLATLHKNNMNGILADEMGLGKTIQTIALLAHLACDRGIWGPHLIVVPTSVILNWEMEFKKFLPGFKVISYHGGPARRKELRKGWTDKYQFNVCITSYTLASRDQVIFKRKPWYYMILDEAHMIKNFKSQRWNTLLMFRSWRRLLLTGTPLQNNLTELWALLQFLMSGTTFANLKEFSDWFSNPLEKAVEMSVTFDEETLERASKLHTVLRPYLLRRLKRDVEKELPQKHEHLVLCPLSKRQRYLYDEFMSRATTTEDLQSGVYQKIANILMQLRKVCNHPDLFEVRPIVTSFAMQKSALADFEIKELLIRKRWMEDQEDAVDLDLFNLRFTPRQFDVSEIASRRIVELDATSRLPYCNAILPDPPPKDTRTIAGYRRYKEWEKRADAHARWSHIQYLNRLRCNRNGPIYSSELLSSGISKLVTPLLPLSKVDKRFDPTPSSHTTWRTNTLVKSYEDREAEMATCIDRFAFVTPPVVALDVPRVALADSIDPISRLPPSFDAVLHRPSVKLQIAFPDRSLLQYDCGKLQKLAELLREKKLGGHRILIFTQMTRILDILEEFLNFHGYLYLRLDGATKIEDRQYITERFNADSRVFCFISSSRSGGVGINLTGADTVIFYDSDFNPQMDRQCEDRAHRIGQIRDVHIYRFVSQHTVEEAMLRKANQKRSLDDLVIQKGAFDWRTFFSGSSSSTNNDNDSGIDMDTGTPPAASAALTRALGQFDDEDDQRAAELAEKEAWVLEGADEDDFGGVGAGERVASGSGVAAAAAAVDEDGVQGDNEAAKGGADEEEEEEEGDEGGTTIDYMVSFVEEDWEFFSGWRV